MPLCLTGRVDDWTCMLLTDGILKRSPHPRVPRFGIGALGDELVHLVGSLEHAFNVDALDGREAVFDEEGVGLPVGRAGAAVRRCEVRGGGGVVEGRCEREGKE